MILAICVPFLLAGFVDTIRPRSQRYGNHRRRIDHRVPFRGVNPGIQRGIPRLRGFDRNHLGLDDKRLDTGADDHDDVRATPFLNLGLDADDLDLDFDSLGFGDDEDDGFEDFDADDDHDDDDDNRNWRNIWRLQPRGGPRGGRSRGRTSGRRHHSRSDRPRGTRHGHQAHVHRK